MDFPSSSRSSNVPSSHGLVCRGSHGSVCPFALDDITRSLICCQSFYCVNFQSISDVKISCGGPVLQVTKRLLKYVYRNMSLFDALVLFCMRGEHGDGYEFVNVYFFFANILLHQVIPLIHRLLFLGVYNNENGTGHISACSIMSTIAMHIISRRHNALTLSIYYERCKTHIIDI